MSKDIKNLEQIDQATSANHNASSYSCIRSPYVTEKSYVLFQRDNTYTFLVYPTANKPEIKKAVEGLYNVKVQAVRISNKKPQQTFVRGKKGKTAGFKKAIITLQAGYSINI